MERFPQWTRRTIIQKTQRTKPSVLAVGQYHYSAVKNAVRRIESIIDGIVYYQDQFVYAACKPASFCAWSTERIDGDTIVPDLLNYGHNGHAERLIDNAVFDAGDIPFAGFPQESLGIYVPRHTVIDASTRSLAEVLAEGISPDKDIRKSRNPKPDTLKPGQYFAGGKNLWSVRRIYLLRGGMVFYTDVVSSMMCSIEYFCKWSAEAVIPDTDTYSRIRNAFGRL